MMKKLKTTLLAATLLLTVTGVAPAATITQTESFNLTETASGSGNITIVDNNGLTATFSPFDQSLGTLLSFLIEWDLLLEIEGTIGGSDGGFSAGMGGGLFIDSINYSGDSNGGGDGGTPGTFVSDSIMLFVSSNFSVANAGATYDPAILATVLGMSNFDVNFQSSPDTVSMSFSNMANITAALTGSVTLTYDYTPAIPAPASSLLLLLGLSLMVRQWRLQNS